MPSKGSIMKSLREKFGYVQEKVADFLGVSRELVSMYETGEREIPIEVMEKLSDLFYVSPEIFMTDDPAEAEAHIAFAFRKDDFDLHDLTELAAFGKIVKNYIKIRRLDG